MTTARPLKRKFTIMLVTFSHITPSSSRTSPNFPIYDNHSSRQPSNVMMKMFPSSLILFKDSSLYRFCSFQGKSLGRGQINPDDANEEPCGSVWLTWNEKFRARFSSPSRRKWWASLLLPEGIWWDPTSRAVVKFYNVRISVKCWREKLGTRPAPAGEKKKFRFHFLWRPRCWLAISCRAALAAGLLSGKSLIISPQEDGNKIFQLWCFSQ